MMTEEQSCVLGLLRKSLLSSSTTVISEGIDVSAIANIILHNGILLTVYPYLGEWQRLRFVLQAEYYASISQSVSQDHEGKHILQALNKEGMRCMMLKGWEVRHLYPDKHMRQMSDLDILIEPYETSRLSNVLVGLGFTESREESSNWKRGSFYRSGIHVETFRCLTDEGGAARAWETEIWNRALREDGNVLRMTYEDVYIHHLVHMRKDLLNGILGLRRILDMWLLDYNLEGHDKDYVSQKLNAMGLVTFRERMSRLGRVCMGTEAPDDDMELLLEYAMTHGIYSTGDMDKTARAARAPEGGMLVSRVSPVLSEVFLPYDKMSARFPELESRPLLLPHYWMKRVMQYIRSRDMSAVRESYDYSSVSSSDLAEMRRMLKAAGCL